MSAKEFLEEKRYKNTETMTIRISEPVKMKVIRAAVEKDIGANELITIAIEYFLERLDRYEADEPKTEIHEDAIGADDSGDVQSVYRPCRGAKMGCEGC